MEEHQPGWRLPRASGLLLHPTCLPGPHHIGDLGEASYWFVDFLQQAKQRFWAVLPLGPAGYGDSPYSGHSAFAGNPMLISLTELHRQGLLDANELIDPATSSTHRTDFSRARAFKTRRLRLAFERFAADRGEEQPEFAVFCEQALDWLEDYALFMSLKEVHGEQGWNDWTLDLAQRAPMALVNAERTLALNVRYHRFLQYTFQRQWTQLKGYANAHGVRFIGDLPIFVAQDSADVWAGRDQFLLDSDGRPTYLAGAPPDYFSAVGQLWGNPLYDWERQATDRFQWWIRRFRVLQQRVDVVRVDHFRGFHSCWAVPPGRRTAEHGTWIAGPGAALFEAVMAAVGSLAMFVEDTGFITQEVDALRERLGLPGIRILHWGFQEPAAFHGAYAVQPDAITRHLPHNFPRRCVVYTSTHDTDTSAGWFVNLNARERTHLLRYLGCNGVAISHLLIRLALSSIADISLIAVQDVLGLGSEARMNVPGRVDGNWTWRLMPGQLTSDHATMLAELTEMYGRAEPSEAV